MPFLLPTLGRRPRIINNDLKKQSRPMQKRGMHMHCIPLFCIGPSGGFLNDRSEINADSEIEHGIIMVCVAYIFEVVGVSFPVGFI